MNDKGGKIENNTYNDDVISRIKYLIAEEGLTRARFAELIEINASNLSKHLTGKLPINDSLINKIVVNLGVSKEWLKNGNDVPFAKKSNDVKSITVAENSLTNIESKMKGTPVYDIDVTAGPLSRASMFAQENIIGMIDIPSVPENCRIVKVSGDSMNPVINNGDLLAVRELSNRNFIYWGQIYVLMLDDYRMVKYVRKHNNPDFVILRSENPNYDDMEIAKSDIREMMIVQNIIHIDSRM